MKMDSCKRILENRIINGNVYLFRNTGTLVFDAEEKFKEFSIEVIVQEIKETRTVNKCQLEIFYGNDFVLDSILLECSSESDKSSLVEKLEVETEALNNSTYKTNFERKIRREINLINHVYDTNDESRINIQVAKTLFQEIDLKVTDQQIAKLFYSSTHNSEISVQQLLKFIFEEVFKKQEILLRYRIDDYPSLKGEYIGNENELDFFNFRKFLSHKQREDSHLLQRKQARILKHFLMDVQNEFISPSEFLNFLFSDRNGIMEKNVLQDMSKPLAYYYIATSHNTYLTGNQLSSTSTEEAYARVLRQGCRCIELDCWASQERIMITHGYTATSKISFESVLNTIKRHAFETTPYPLILSIENHCPVALQREMARLFKNIFGEMLLTAPLKEDETELPSPNDLKNRILLKFKKIAKEDETSTSLSTYPDDLEEEEEDADEEEEDNKEKVDGISRRSFLWVKTMSSLEWQTKLFSLFEKSLISYETERDDDDDEENGRTFSYELWYHGTLSSEQLQEILSCDDNPKPRDGTFFVANVHDESIYEYLCLTVWKDEVPFPLLINCDLNEMNEQMFAISSETFNSLEELINYYKLYSLQVNYNKEDNQDFLNEPYQLEVKLSSPLYQMDDHTKMEWFHSSLTKDECNRVMGKVGIKGAFLVRNSESSPGNLTLVFCSTSNVIRRLIIMRQRTYYTINESLRNKFKSVVNLIEYLQFNKSRIFLYYPVTRKRVKEILRGSDKGTETIYSLEKAELLIEPSKGVVEIGLEIWAFRLNLHSKEHIMLGCREYNQAKLWFTAIKEAINRSDQVNESSEKRYKVAKEMSDITVYFQKGVFNKDNIKGIYNQVFSFEEDDMASHIHYHPQDILKFHKISISRIYPKGTRVKSNNFNPLPFWLYGCQMVALNYQTGDLGMQLNTAWFQQNNNCGYVSRPHCSVEVSNEPIQLEITVLGARVMCGGKGRINPILLHTEIQGIGHDKQWFTTELEGDLLCLSLKNPEPETHVILIRLPEFALLQFTLYGKNRSNTIGQYTIHVNDIKEKGYRSVPLKNKYSERLLLSSLLVYVRKWKKVEVLQRIHKLRTNFNIPAGSGYHHRKWGDELDKAENILKKLKEAEKKKAKSVKN